MKLHTIVPGLMRFFHRQPRCAALAVALSVAVAGLLVSHGAVALLAQQPAAAEAADTILVNGRIYTVNSRQPWAEALAIRGGKIVAAGTAAEVEQLRGPATQVLDAHGHLVLPGLTDCHIHFISGALALGQVQLDGARSVAEIQQRVREYVAAHPGTGWILGRGWVYATFGSEALPHKKLLDEVAPDRPVLLEAYDGHTYWANSKALEMAGITRETPDPPNGQIVRDPATGEPTGALKEGASGLVERIVPKPTRAEKLEALRAGMAAANRVGLTRVHSAGGDFEELPLYRELGRAGALTVRMDVSYFLNPAGLTPAVFEEIERARREYHGDWLSAGAVKTMLDGVIESHTAAMSAPYSDAPELKGSMFWDAQGYKAAVVELNRRGFQIFTHAIGDAAVGLALDAYEEAAAAYHTPDSRHRIEHIETIRASDVARFGGLGVVASFQPLHAYPDANTLQVWARNVGPERVARAFAWQSVASAEGKLAFGSDWPVVTLNPWAGLQTAVTRETEDRKPAGGWIPKQRISLAQAIEAYTLGAAIAGRREKSEGSLEPGKLADLVVVSQNLFEIDAHEIGRTEVLVTVVGGKVVYQAASWTNPGKSTK